MNRVWELQCGSLYVKCHLKHFCLQNNKIFFSAAVTVICIHDLASGARLTLLVYAYVTTDAYP